MADKMSCQEISFTSFERKIIGWWLAVSVILPLIILSLVFITVIIGSLIGFDEASGEKDWFSMVIGISFMFLLIYVPYRCVYKGYGNFLFWIQMINAGFNLVVVFFLEAINLFSKGEYQENFYLIPLLLIFVACKVGFFYLAYQMRKINLRIARERLFKSKNFQEAYLFFSNLQNKEELAERNREFKYPESSLGRNEVYQAYKTRLNELST